LADLSEWPISTVSQAALERTINSFDTALSAPLQTRTLSQAVLERTYWNRQLYS